MTHTERGICWSTPHMAAMARSKPDQSQEPGTPIESLTWVQGTKTLSQLALFSRCISRDFDKKQGNWDFNGHAYRCWPHKPLLYCLVIRAYIGYFSSKFRF